MISKTNNPSDEQWKQINKLIKSCEKFDKASTCIQIDHSLNCNTNIHSWFLQYKESKLIGICSIFAPMPHEAEFSICIHPKMRNQENAGTLLKQSLYEYKNEGVKKILLVCDNRSISGQKYINKKNFKLNHTEYTLHYQKSKKANSGNTNRLSIETAKKTDLKNLAEVFSTDVENFKKKFLDFIQTSLDNKNRILYVGRYANEIIATCAVSKEKKTISITTVAVKKAFQKQGFAFEMIQSVINQKIKSKRKIYLDVNSTNIPAYSLYIKLGFSEVKKALYFIIS